MKKNVLTIILTFFIGLVSAQEARFSVKVSNDSILMGNYFSVTFTLENASGSDFEAPPFDDFTVVGGPNQSSSFSMVNGKVSQSLSFSYQLEPKDVGNYYIHPANIKAGEEVLETTPLEIIVVPNPDGVIQRQEQRNGMEPDLFFERNPIPRNPKKPKKRRKFYWL